MLFQVFGDREELKAAPIAYVDGGKLAALSLDAQGWRFLDSVFFAAGRQLPLYRFGSQVGAVEVLRGMWPADSAPLYELAGCRTVVPQARLRFRTSGAVSQNVEFLASSTPLKQPAEGRPLPSESEALARRLADTAAIASGVGHEELGRIEFTARWMRTGAGTQGRTLLGNYVDPDAGDAGPGAGHTISVLILAEDSARTMATSYAHVSSGESRTVEFQRLMNHADLDGDGVDEIVLEAWRYAQLPSLVVLKREGARWTEAFRVSQNWCLDRPVAGATP